MNKSYRLIAWVLMISLLLTPNSAYALWYDNVFYNYYYFSTSDGWWGSYYEGTGEIDLDRYEGTSTTITLPATIDKYPNAPVTMNGLELPYDQIERIDIPEQYHTITEDQIGTIYALKEGCTIAFHNKDANIDLPIEDCKEMQITIEGYSESTAQEFANSADLPFVLLGEGSTPNEELPDVAEIMPYVRVDAGIEEGLVATVTGGRGMDINIESNTNWAVDVVSGYEWITLSCESGSGNGAFYTTIGDNTYGAAREGWIRVSADGCEPINIKVTQGEMPEETETVTEDIICDRIISDVSSMTCKPGETASFSWYLENGSELGDDGYYLLKIFDGLTAENYEVKTKENNYSLDCQDSKYTYRIDIAIDAYFADGRSVLDHTIAINVPISGSSISYAEMPEVALNMAINSDASGDYICPTGTITNYGEPLYGNGPWEVGFMINQNGNGWKKYYTYSVPDSFDGTWEPEDNYYLEKGETVQFCAYIYTDTDTIYSKTWNSSSNGENGSSNAGNETSSTGSTASGGTQAGTGSDKYLGDMYIVNCNEWVSLRSKRSSSSTRIAKVPRGALVNDVFIKNSSGFAFCNYNGQTGYIQIEYLGKTPDSYVTNLDEYQGEAQVINCDSWVSLRREPDTSSEKLAEVPLGAIVDFHHGGYGEFAYVHYNGEYGYILKKYLAAKGYTTSETEKTPDSYVTDLDEYQGNAQVINCDSWVPLHRNPDSSSQKLAEVPLGAIVDFRYGGYGEFAYVYYNGEYGYILKNNLAAIETEDGTPLIFKQRLAAPQRVFPTGEADAIYNDSKNILLKWTAVADATQYKVYIKDVTNIPTSEWNNSNTDAPSVFPNDVFVHDSYSIVDNTVSLNVGTTAAFKNGHTYKACIMASDGNAFYGDSGGPVFFFSVKSEQDIISSFNIHMTQENNNLTAYMNSSVTAKWESPDKKSVGGYTLEGYLIELSTTKNGVKQYAKAEVDANATEFKQRLHEWTRVDGGIGVEETRKGDQSYLWSVTPIIRTPEGNTIYGNMSAFNLTVYAAMKVDTPKGLDVTGEWIPWSGYKIDPNADKDITASWNIYKGNGQRLRLVWYKEGTDEYEDRLGDYPVSNKATRKTLEKYRLDGEGTYVAKLYAVYSESLYDGCVYTYVESKPATKEFKVGAYNNTNIPVTIPEGNNTNDAVNTTESTRIDYTYINSKGKEASTALVSVSPKYNDASISNLLAILNADSIYGVGDYFSKTGSACSTCHDVPSEILKCGSDEDCTCISVVTVHGKELALNSSQCFAYARYVFASMFSTANNVSYQGKELLQEVVINEENKSKIITSMKEVCIGSHIRVSKPHSMVLLSADDYELTVLECNHSGKCKISMRTITWKDFFSSGGYGGYTIEYVMVPSDYKEPETEGYDSKQLRTESDNLYAAYTTEVKSEDIERFLVELNSPLSAGKYLEYGYDFDANNRSNSGKGLENSRSNAALMNGNIDKLTPAEIIYYAALENNCNVVYLLATLQKEQSLITKVREQKDINLATGYGSSSGFLAQLLGCTYTCAEAKKNGYLWGEAYNKYTPRFENPNFPLEEFVELYTKYAKIMDHIISNQP